MKQKMQRFYTLFCLMKKIINRGLILPVLLVILNIPLFYNLVRPGFFPMQDDLQAFRIQQMVKCLKDFQIPCRWIPDMGYKYGYPQFNFYPPSIFYLGGVMNLTGIQVIDAVKILFILGFILSAITMYIFLKSTLGKWPAFVGSMLYNVVPYKATEVYVRGSLSEFWAFVFFPLIFWSSYQLINSGRLKYFIWLSLSLALLLTTHNLMSFIFLLPLTVWILAVLIIYRKWQVFPKIILSFLLGLGLAAFFTIPVIFEGKFVHLETLTGGYFDWRQHFVDLKQLFLSNQFGYGSSQLGPNDDLSLSVGIVHWVLALFAFILSAVYFKRDKKISILVMALSGVELIILFLMHQKSSFIWEKLPGLYLLQFPWRFLSDSTFILSFLGSIGIYIIGRYQKKVAVVAGIAVILALFILHGSFFKPKDWFYISDTDKFSGPSWEKQLTISIFDYLPIYAKLPPNKKAPDFPETLDGKAEFISYQKGSDFQKSEVNITEQATLRLPLFDFPGMEVQIDGKKVNHWHDDCRDQPYCLGLITFKINQGTHQFEARLKNTPVRSISNIITIVSILIVLGLFINIKRDDKNFA